MINKIVYILDLVTLEKKLNLNLNKRQIHVFRLQYIKLKGKKVNSFQFSLKMLKEKKILINIV